MSKKAGRPKSQLDLPEGWKETLLELYAQGGSNVEAQALIIDWRGSCSNDLWARWLKEEPEFSETIKKGKVLCEAWWVKNGRSNLTNKEFNYTGFYMQMKNRFGWRDKIETDNKHDHGGVTFNIDLNTNKDQDDD